MGRTTNRRPAYPPGVGYPPRQLEGDAAYSHVVWEADVKRMYAIDLVNVLFAEGHFKRLDICVKVFHLSPANNREDVGRLLHDICDSDCEKPHQVVLRILH